MQSLQNTPTPLILWFTHNDQQTHQHFIVIVIIITVSLDYSQLKQWSTDAASHVSRHSKDTLVFSLGPVIGTSTHQCRVPWATSKLHSHHHLQCCQCLHPTSPHCLRPCHTHTYTHIHQHQQHSVVFTPTVYSTQQVFQQHSVVFTPTVYSTQQVLMTLNVP